MAEFEVKGLRELQAAMNKLRGDMANKIARQATAAGAGVVRKAAKARAPKDSGNLQAALVMKRVRNTPLTEEYIVTVRQGKRSDIKKAKAGTGALGRDAYYARFVEFGTVKMPPRPFIAPALSENIGPATEAMKKRLAARLKKAGAL
jgi:HK97 gp10 family phage protein